MISLRKAHATDAVVLANFCDKTFKDTFSKDNSSADMDLYISKAFNVPVILKEIEDSHRITMLAFDNTLLAGFYQLHLGNLEPDITGPNPVELVRLYVDTKWHGQGVAASLMEHGIKQSIELGFSTLWLGVWENNFRAQAFYKKWGFSQVGSHIFKLGNDPQRDLLLSRSL